MFNPPPITPHPVLFNYGALQGAHLLPGQFNSPPRGFVPRPQPGSPHFGPQPIQPGAPRLGPQPIAQAQPQVLAALLSLLSNQGNYGVHGPAQGQQNYGY